MANKDTRAKPRKNKRKPDAKQKTEDPVNARYEYRVWGGQRKARKLLASLATSSVNEQVADCYFLTDDPDWNTKVRDSTLKVKRLVTEEKGFEVWTRESPDTAKSTPPPFDQLFDDLHLDRVARGKKYSLPKAIKGLDDDHEARPVFVTKDRTRYRVGTVRAEVTDITIDATGEVLRTLAIEGDDLDELVALRKKLGLKGKDNVPVHVAIDAEVSS